MFAQYCKILQISKDTFLYPKAKDIKMTEHRVGTRRFNVRRTDDKEPIGIDLKGDPSAEMIKLFYGENKVKTASTASRAPATELFEKLIRIYTKAGANVDGSKKNLNSTAIGSLTGQNISSLRILVFRCFVPVLSLVLLRSLYLSGDPIALIRTQKKDLSTLIIEALIEIGSDKARELSLDTNFSIFLTDLDEIVEPLGIDFPDSEMTYQRAKGFLSNTLKKLDEFLKRLGTTPAVAIPVKDGEDSQPSKVAPAEKEIVKAKRDEIGRQAFDEASKSFKKGVDGYTLLLGALDAYNIDDPAIKSIKILDNDKKLLTEAVKAESISEKTSSGKINLTELLDILFLCTAPDLQVITGFDANKLGDTFLDFKVSRINPDALPKIKDVLKESPDAIKIIEVFQGSELKGNATVGDLVESIKKGSLALTNKAKVKQGLAPLDSTGQPKSGLFQSSYTPLIVGGMLLAGIAIGYNVYSKKKKD